MNDHQSGWTFKNILRHTKRNSKTLVFQGDGKKIRNSGIGFQDSRWECKEKDRVKLLDELRFEQRLIGRRKWMDMYERRVAYKKENGNANVPACKMASKKTVYGLQK